MLLKRVSCTWLTHRHHRDQRINSAFDYTCDFTYMTPFHQHCSKLSCTCAKCTRAAMYEAAVCLRDTRQLFEQALYLNIETVICDYLPYISMGGY